MSKPKVDLCEELIVEIFSRLPTKSLLRFRSVSKSLRVLIGSPDFIRLHALRSPKKLTTIHRIRNAEDKSMYTMHSEGQLSSYAGITPVDYPFGLHFRIVGSCNGIICVYEPYERGAIHLWNPSIRRKATVDDLPSSGAACFAHGFGFDPIIDDYKIVRILEKDGGTFIYTMKTRTWREIASPTSPVISFFRSSQCLFNGALHWVVGVNQVDYYCRYMMKFDLSSEVFSTIELPEPGWLTAEVTIIKGCLAVISSKHYGAGWWIWVRNTADASWSLAWM